MTRETAEANLIGAWQARLKRVDGLTELPPATAEEAAGCQLLLWGDQALARYTGPRPEVRALLEELATLAPVPKLTDADLEELRRPYWKTDCQ